MNCGKASSLLSEKIDRELPKKASVSLLRHLSECPSCRKRLEELEVTSRLVGKTIRMLPRPPAGFSTHLMTRIARLPVPQEAPRQPLIHLVTKPAFSIAAGILILSFVFFLLFDKNSGSPETSGRRGGENRLSAQKNARERRKLERELALVQVRIKDLEIAIGQYQATRESLRSAQDQKTADDKQGALSSSLEKSLELIAQIEDALLTSGLSNEDTLNDLFSALKKKIPSPVIRNRLHQNKFSMMDLFLAKLLAHDPDPESADFFMQELANRRIPPEFRQAYAEGIRRSNLDPSHLPLIEMLAESPSEDESVRLSLIEALYRADPEGSIECLSELAQNDMSHRIRGVALQQLAKTSNEGLIPLFEEVINNTNATPDNIVISLEALARIGSGEALEALSLYLLDFPPNGDSFLRDKAKQLLNAGDQYRK